MRHQHMDGCPFQRCFGYALMLMLAVAAVGCTWLTALRAEAAAPGGDQERLDALYLEARLLMSVHQYQEAAERLDQALDLPNCTPEVYVSRAEVYVESADGVEPARKLLDEGLKRFQDDPSLLIEKAQVEEQAGRIDEAIALLERVLAKQPNRRSVLERLAQLHLKKFRTIRTADQLKGEINGLISVYQRMLAGSKGIERIPPLLVLSSLYLRVNKGDEALKMAKEAAAIRPNDTRPQLALANVNQYLNRPADALAAYRRALEINPSLDDALKGVSDLLQNNPDKIVDFYRGLAKDRPNAASVQFQFAQLLIQARRWQEAESVLRRILGGHPEHEQAHLALMTVLRSQKRVSDALEVGMAALKTDPTNTDFLSAEGEALRELKTPQQRSEWYRRLANGFENQKEVQLLIGRELVREELWPDAEKQLDSILKKWPGDVASRLARVRVWLALKKVDKAADEARALAAEKSELATVVALAVAENMNSNGRAADAIRFITEMRRLRPDDEGLVVWQGWVLFGQKRNDEALAMLEQFRAAHPASFDVISILVDGYAEQGRYDKAQAVLDGVPKSLMEQKGDDILLLRVTLDRRRHKLPEALAAMQKLITRNPNNAGYWLQLGIIQQDLGQMSEAERSYMRAIELDPKDPENYNTLGYFYAETNQKLDIALDLVTRALSLKPDAGHIVDSLGWVYYQRGDYKKAVEALGRAVKLMGDREDPVVYDHLGDAYAKTGDTTAALEAWRKALELKPEKPEAIRKKIDSSAK
ncbi:tetratricopeptide repeat protein [bacterium]|nr:tetratricopeptide repeat protein [bacterium]